VIGTVGVSGSSNGVLANLANISSPSSLALDKSGNIYISESEPSLAETQCPCVPAPRLSLHRSPPLLLALTSPPPPSRCPPTHPSPPDAGGGYPSGNGFVYQVNSSGIIRRLGSYPVTFGVFTLANGTLLISRSFNNSICAYRPATNTCTPVVGQPVNPTFTPGVGPSGGFGGDGAAASAAKLWVPAGGVGDPNDTNRFWFCDSYNHRCGPRSARCLLLRPASAAPHQALGRCAIGPQPADSARLLPLRRVRMVSNGNITTVAGNGTKGSAGDGGPAARASLDEPYAVTLDNTGNLLIAEKSGRRVRRVDAVTGIITTVAGRTWSTEGEGSTGDKGLATQATLASPMGLAVDQWNNIFVGDSGGRRIRCAAAGACAPAAPRRARCRAASPLELRHHGCRRQPTPAATPVQARGRHHRHHRLGGPGRQLPRRSGHGHCDGHLVHGPPALRRPRAARDPQPAGPPVDVQPLSTLAAPAGPRLPAPARVGAPVPARPAAPAAGLQLAVHPRPHRHQHHHHGGCQAGRGRQRRVPVPRRRRLPVGDPDQLPGPGGQPARVRQRRQVHRRPDARPQPLVLLRPGPAAARALRL
jgi:hypothetical protein